MIAEQLYCNAYSACATAVVSSAVTAVSDCSATGSVTNRWFLIVSVKSLVIENSRCWSRMYLLTAGSSCNNTANSFARGECFACELSLALVSSRLEKLYFVFLPPDARSKSVWFILSTCSPCVDRLIKMKITGKYFFQVCVNIYRVLKWTYNSFVTDR